MPLQCTLLLIVVVLILCIRNVTPLPLRSSNGERTQRPSLNSKGRLTQQRDVGEPKAVMHYTYKAVVEASNPSILIDFVAEKFNAKKTQAKQWLTYKSVYVNDEVQVTYNFDLRLGDIVSVRLGKVVTTMHSNSGGVGGLPNGLKIVHEDSSIIVAEKPYKMLVSTKDTATKDKTVIAIQTALHHINSVLGKRKKSSKAMVVHSLDEEASGLMIFAKTLPARDYLLTNWHFNVGKTYTCICYGKLSPLQGIMSCSEYDESLKGVGVLSKSIGDEKITSSDQASSIKYNYTSSYRSLDLSSDMPYSMVEFSLDRMSTEQLKVKLSQLGKPIVGDTKYITDDTGGDYDPLRRLCMHCTEIKLFHPETKEKMSFQSHVPPSFISLLRRESGGGHTKLVTVKSEEEEEEEEEEDDRIYEKRNIEIVKISDFLKQPKRK